MTVGILPANFRSPGASQSCSDSHHSHFMNGCSHYSVWQRVFSFLVECCVCAVVVRVRRLVETIISCSCLQFPGFVPFRLPVLSHPGQGPQLVPLAGLSFLDCSIITLAEQRRADPIRIPVEPKRTDRFRSGLRAAQGSRVSSNRSDGNSTH